MSILATTILLASATVLSQDMADHDEVEAKIASAMSAGPDEIASEATIVDSDGTVLREGDNGWTCFPATPSMGAMCNDAEWAGLLTALMAGEDYSPSGFGVSYMLAGDGDAPGVSNIDPAATEPTEDNDWIKEGPHLMLIMPDPAMMDGMSTDINDPVYVMWKDTPYAHVMIRLEAEE